MVVPADIPVATPVPMPIVPTAVVPLLHVPPANGWVSVVVSPSQTDNVPLIDTGAGVTVSTLVAVQPPLSA